MSESWIYLYSKDKQAVSNSFLHLRGTEITEEYFLAALRYCLTAKLIGELILIIKKEQKGNSF